MILLGARARIVLRTSRCAEVVAFLTTKGIDFTASQAIFSRWAWSFIVGGLDDRFTWGCNRQSSRGAAKTRRKEGGLHCDSYSTLGAPKWLGP